MGELDEGILLWEQERGLRAVQARSLEWSMKSTKPNSTGRRLTLWVSSSRILTQRPARTLTYPGPGEVNVIKP
jgi:hypothetical protein